MGRLSGFWVTLRQMFKPRLTTEYPHGQAREARRASTAVTSSTATRTAWRSASAASCARACARRAASTCAAPTTRSTTRSRRASATASSTRSTTSAASTATCASRRARPRRSPRRSSSSSRSPTAPTRSTPRTSCSSATTAGPSACRGSCGSAARTTTRARGCARRRRRGARRRTKAASAGRASSASASARRSTARADGPTGRGERRLMDAVIFFVCAAAVLVGALGVVLARNPVHSALFLLLTLVSVAVLFLQQDADARRDHPDRRVRERDRRAVPVRDHAARRRPARVASTSRSPFQRPVAIVLGALLLVAGRRARRATTGSTGAALVRRGTLDAARHGNVQTLATSLFTDLLWAFEITAVLLVIAVVGGVVLARRSGQRPSRAGDASRRGGAVVIAAVDDHSRPTTSSLAAVAVHDRRASGCSCGATRS